MAPEAIKAGGLLSRSTDAYSNLPVTMGFGIICLIFGDSREIRSKLSTGLGSAMG